MLSVTIPWDLTNAPVKMDMREMEPTAQVSQKPRYQTMFSHFFLLYLEKLWSVIICEGGNGTISCDNDRRTIDVVEKRFVYVADEHCC